MKDFIFVSDFDGTMTQKDFYHIVIDKYLDWGRDYYNEWKKEKAIDLFFLNKIFGSINKKEEDILSDILTIPFDDTAIPFIKNIKDNGGDFVILSAGTSYYISKMLEYKGIKDITLISNEGIYKSGGIQLIADEKGPYYSEIFGIDKGKAVIEFKKQYKKVYYAGDSEPDLTAALEADVVFAKPGLQSLLQDKNHEFIPFNEFKEINNYMLEKGWLK